jgi:hypothetical protein
MDAKGNQQVPQEESGGSSKRWLGIVMAGVGLGAALVYLLSGRLRGRREEALRLPHRQKIVDDRGTGQAEASRMLRNLRDRAFEASDDKMALALGRPIEDVVAWYEGRELVDDDVVMKARGIAMYRGVVIE